MRIFRYANLSAWTGQVEKSIGIHAETGLQIRNWKAKCFVLSLNNMVHEVDDTSHRYKRLLYHDA